MTAVLHSQCAKCYRRRQLRLVCTEPSGIEHWYCRRCQLAFDRDVAGVRAIALRMFPALGAEL